MRDVLTDLYDRLAADWGAVLAWLLGFGLIVYLGLNGGGFDALIHDQVGIAVWWIALVAVLVGALPRRNPGALGWAALGLFAAFTVWTALSLIWTESPDKTWDDIAYISTYLGIFALAVFSRGPRAARQMVGAVGAGIAVVSLVALLSRLHPSWFPEARETGEVLDDLERLAYPLNYWNALAGLIAIGLPLLLHTATEARSVLLRALSAAALPALALTAFFTLSRGGIGAAVAALIVFLALTSDRLAKLLTLLIAGAGAAVLISAVIDNDALQEGLLNQAARDQGDEVLVLTLVVCAVVGLLQAGIALALQRRMRPRWTEPSRGQSLAFAAAGLVAVIIAAAAIDAPGRISNGWDEFKEPVSPGSGTERLTSVAGQARYQFWSSAVRQNSSEPITGTGAGTFEYWWARDADVRSVVRDTHSVYFQVLGELGIVGVSLFAAFLLTILGGGIWALGAASPRGRSQLAAAVAGCTAFCITAIYDWMWQISVLPVALLLLGAVLVTATATRDRDVAALRRLPVRLTFLPIALAAIAAIAIPLAAASLLRDSEAEFRDGDVSGAIESARSAQNVLPGAARPRLQEALVLEAQGELDPAAEAAREATDREATNWRNWLVLSRIEAERGRAEAAVRYYRRAKSLNPLSPLFER